VVLGADIRETNVNIASLNEIVRAQKGRPYQTRLDRFWSYVDKRSSDKCWNWTGAASQSGYGWFHLKDKMEKVHRISRAIHNGPIPKDDSHYGSLLVCHKCDNKLCVNPQHLFVGTCDDNLKDMVRKGRGAGATGKSNGNGKLSDRNVDEIRMWHSVTGAALKTIAGNYGISESHTRGIIKHRKRKLTLAPT